jgi:P27 family predicted phage terminase small subunit
MDGRKPKSPELKALLGRPVRTRVAPLKFHGVARCPTNVLRTREERAEWRRISLILGPAGMATSADAMLMILWCSNVARWLTAKAALAEKPNGPQHQCARSGCEELTWEKFCPKHGGNKPGFGLVAVVKGRPVENPFLRIAERAEAQLMKLADQFGLSPLARQRLCMPLLGGAAATAPRVDQDIAESFFEVAPDGSDTSVN